MNKQRREAITSELGKLAEVRSALETLRDEEQDCYDNMPESFQDGEKGEAAQEAIEKLDNMISSLEEIEGEDFS